MATSTEWFTPTSAYSLAFVASIGVVAWVSAPKNAKSFDRFTWIWMVRASTKTCFANQLDTMSRSSTASFISRLKLYSCITLSLVGRSTQALEYCLRWVRSRKWYREKHCTDNAYSEGIRFG